MFAHPKVGEAGGRRCCQLRWGEEVAAFIRAAPGDPPTVGELSAYCRARLASYKVPRHWEFVDVFPQTASGKIQKFAARERFTAAHPDN